MVAHSWAERLARLPMSEDEVIDGLAGDLHNRPARAGSPWERASDGMRHWVGAEARASLRFLRALKRTAR